MIFDSILKSASINENDVALKPSLYQQLVPSSKIKLVVCVVLFTVIFSLSIMVTKRRYLKELNLKVSHTLQHNLLDGCQYVYVDMGTNIGIQIRKLYEPYLYTGAHVLTSL